MACIAKKSVDSRGKKKVNPGKKSEVGGGQ